MENHIRNRIVVVIVGFVVYQSFFKKSDVVESKPYRSLQTCTVQGQVKPKKFHLRQNLIKRLKQN